MTTAIWREGHAPAHRHRSAFRRTHSASWYACVGVQVIVAAAFVAAAIVPYWI